MEKHFVYWYHLAEHRDVWSQGYVGVTNDLNRRHNEHMRNSNNLIDHFQNAIRHYGKDAIIRTVLHECKTAEEAYELEEMYRPEKNIGWNFAKGGNETLCAVKKKSVTLFHQSNPDIEYTFESAAEAARVLGLSNGRIRQAAHRKRNIYGEDGWTVVTENTNKTTIQSIYEIRRIRMINAQVNGLIPKPKPRHLTDEQKARIGAFHRGKKLSQKHIERLRQFNQLNSPSCRSVILVHQSEPDKQYSYHSISEASRQLELPLARLKSKAQRPLNRYGRDGWKIVSLGSQSGSSDSR